MTKELALFALAFLLSFNSTGCKPMPSQMSVSSELYVSLTGNNNNPGTKELPLRNLNYAVPRLVAGTKLCIGDGVWTSTQDVIDSQRFTVPSGSDLGTGAITIGGCNGDTPTIKPPNTLPAIRLTLNAPHHIIFQDMILDGSLQSDPPVNPSTGYIYDSPELIYTSSGSHHIRFQRLKVQHTMSHAVQVSYNGSTNTNPTYIEFIDNQFSDIGNATGDSGHGGRGINNGYAIYMFTANNLVLGNLFTDNRGTELVVYGSDNTIARNRFTKAGTRGGPSHAINVGSSSHPVPSERNYFVNNYVYENQAGGLQIYTNASVLAWNNTFYKNGNFAIHAQYCQGGESFNNLFTLNIKDLVNDNPSLCRIEEGNNLPSTTDPLFVNPSIGDFRLSSNSSPAYNKGASLELIVKDQTGVTSRPQGILYDIGAYEIPVDTPVDPIIVAGGTKGLVFNLTSSSSVISNKASQLKSLVCNNSTRDRIIVNLFNSDPLSKSEETVQIYTIPTGQNLALTGLDISFDLLKASATNPISCSFGILLK